MHAIMESEREERQKEGVTERHTHKESHREKDSQKKKGWGQTITATQTQSHTFCDHLFGWTNSCNEHIWRRMAVKLKLHQIN